MRAVLGSDHPDVTAGYDCIYARQEKSTTALEKYRGRESIRRSTDTEDSPSMVETTQLVAGVTTQWLESRRNSLS